MRFDEKARENIEAAERLLPDESGVLDALSNAAASRAYYGAYLAVADRAQREHHGMTSSSERGTWYRHDTLPRDARAWGILGEEEQETLELLLGLRVKADYWEDQVSLEEASIAFEDAKDLVERLLGDGAAP